MGDALHERRFNLERRIAQRRSKGSEVETDVCPTAGPSG